MGGYFGYVASAYCFSALALALLGLFLYADGRAARRTLADLEARLPRRRSAGE